MANTIAQNCQRGTIFLAFLAFVFFFILNIINLVKKRIDPIDEESGAGGEKYEEKEKDKQKESNIAAKHESSSTGLQFDGAAISMKAQKIEEDDPIAVKIIKKNEEFQMLYFPILAIFPLNILTGTCKAFSLVNFFFVLIVVIVFNVAKVHRKCLEHVCLLVIFQNLWIILLFFELVNVWGSFTISQPYGIIGV